MLLPVKIIQHEGAKSRKITQNIDKNILPRRFSIMNSRHNTANIWSQPVKENDSARILNQTHMSFTSYHTNSVFRSFLSIICKSGHKYNISGGGNDSF